MRSFTSAASSSAPRPSNPSLYTTILGFQVTEILQRVWSKTAPDLYSNAMKHGNYWPPTHPRFAISDLHDVGYHS